MPLYLTLLNSEHFRLVCILCHFATELFIPYMMIICADTCSSFSSIIPDPTTEIVNNKPMWLHLLYASACPLWPLTSLLKKSDLVTVAISLSLKLISQVVLEIPRYQGQYLEFHKLPTVTVDLWPIFIYLKNLIR